MNFAFFSYLTKINDVYFINQSIKKINKNYELFYNKKTDKYEIHNLNQNHSFILSFDKYPNKKLMIKLLKSLYSNPSKIFKEIENHNLKIERKNIIDTLSLTQDKFKEIDKYSNKKLNFDLNSNQIKKIIQ